MNQIQLLEDYELLDKYESFTESVGGEKRFYVRGVMGRANYANKNKRVYPIPVMTEAVSFARKDVEMGGFVGELDHPAGGPKVNVAEISHKFTKLDLNPNGMLLGECYALDTFKGLQLKALIKDHILLGTSTRALGTVKPYVGTLGEGLVEVNPGLIFKAIDIVKDPSAGTYPEMVMESTVILGQTKKFKEIWEKVFGV